ncbi:MAG: hypothetical protein KDI33_16735 [Halioglobus sp.]|nr:hypothetical protein [Halioglobus sp.]
MSASEIVMSYHGGIMRAEQAAAFALRPITTITQTVRESSPLALENV